MTVDSGAHPRSRQEQLAQNLERLEARIAAACGDAGRDPAGITLVVVTKYFPASDVRHLHALGVRHVAENRHQEAVDKRRECADLGLTWHYVGHLQSNKAAAVGGWADVVQSVDRARLLTGLSRAAHERDRPLDVLVQVNLDQGNAVGDRSGVEPAETLELARRTSSTDGLVLRGLMGVAPLGGDAAEAFASLAGLRDAVAREHPAATWMSAGMSGDLEAALKAGATHVRVGTAVLGNRPAPL
jgi:pyridoxal phosphate enzyme (YggS family)